MKKFLYILFLIFNLQFGILNLYSQPTQQWASRYLRTANSPGIENYLAIDKLGNSYVCGTVFNSVTRNDIVLIKYNSIGDTVWIRRYNNNNNEDFPHGLVVDSIGNTYITSNSGPSGNLNDFLTLKYSPSGLLIWTRIYGNPGINEGANDMKMDKLGNNIYITGTNSNTGSAVTINYNSNGDSLWVRTKQLAGYHYYGQNIAIDGNNNIYTGVVRVNDNNNLDDFLAIKYDVNGNEQWTGIHLNNSGFDGIIGIAVDNLGNSFIAGSHSSSGYLTIKFNSLGIEQWTRQFTNGHGELPYAIVADNNGNCYITGGSSVGSSNFDFLTIKYNPIGDSLWVRRYNGPGNDDDEAYAMTIDDSDNVYISGRSIGNAGWDFATVKYNTYGLQQWVVRYINGIAHSIVVDKFYNVFVTGEVGDVSGPAYGTIKYTQIVGINPISNEIPNQFELEQNYPNPFNPVTNIKFNIPHVGTDPRAVRLVVYDVLGKEVQILVNEPLQPGEYKVDWNASDFPSGVYFYKLVVGDNTNNGGFTETKKMVLLK